MEFEQKTFRPHHSVLPSTAEIPVREPLWTHSFSEGWIMDCSPLYYEGVRYRLVLGTSQGFWGLVLPATKELPPTITHLSMSLSQLSTCAPGIRKAFALDGKGKTGIRIGYNWDRGGGISNLNYKNVEPMTVISGGLCPLFGEEHGRFMYRDRETIRIIDFI